MTRAVFVGLLSVSSGCLDPPRLKGCGELPIGTEGCGSGCAVYCDLLTERCPKQFEAMASGSSAGARDRCVGLCTERLRSSGEHGELRGDSLECRIAWALRAPDDAAACGNAALDGGEACLDANCGDYCQLMVAHCDGAYTSEAACRDACARSPREPGGGVCGDPCEACCDQVMAACTDANAVYADRAQRLSICALLPTGGRFDDWAPAIEADSLHCRVYHAGTPAIVDPGFHCPHTSPYNDVHCGTRCRLVLRRDAARVPRHLRRRRRLRVPVRRHAAGHGAVPVRGLAVRLPLEA